MKKRNQKELEARARLKDGIEPYEDERALILAKMQEPMSQHDFDNAFTSYPTGKFRRKPMAGHAFMLGSWMYGYGHISWWLDLLQKMVAAGEVVQSKQGEVFYYQAANPS